MTLLTFRELIELVDWIMRRAGRDMDRHARDRLATLRDQLLTRAENAEKPEQEKQTISAEDIGEMPPDLMGLL